MIIYLFNNMNKVACMSRLVGWMGYANIKLPVDEIGNNCLY